MKLHLLDRDNKISVTYQRSWHMIIKTTDIHIFPSISKNASKLARKQPSLNQKTLGH